jgi:hypothetical protein
MKFYPGSAKLIDVDVPELKTEFPELHVFALDESGESSVTHCIFVEEGLEPDQVITAFNNRQLRHLVQKNKGQFEQTLISTGRLIRSGSNYFKSEYCFPDEPPQRSLLVQFGGREDKENLKKKSNEFLEIMQSPSVFTAADAIIEELYMNAVIDAPREAAKRGFPTESTVSELFLCQTNGWLQISCSDPFGSLEVSKFLQRMQEVYVKGAGVAINLADHDLGAGLGCVILFEQCTSLILGVDPGKKTKVTCMIPLGVSNRQRSQMKKSLHCVEF